MQGHSILQRGHWPFRVTQRACDWEQMGTKSHDPSVQGQPVAPGKDGGWNSCWGIGEDRKNKHKGTNNGRFRPCLDHHEELPTTTAALVRVQIKYGFVRHPETQGTACSFAACNDTAQDDENAETEVPRKYPAAGSFSCFSTPCARTSQYIVQGWELAHGEFSDISNSHY